MSYFTRYAVFSMQGSLIVKAEESMRCKTHTVYNQAPVWKYRIQTTYYFGC